MAKVPMEPFGRQSKPHPFESEPAVSIIVPVLNEAGIVQEAISELRRLPGSFEVIIVDGGSGDTTRDLASEAIATDPRFRLIVSSPGRGAQMNAGAAVSQGRALLFLHADTQLPESAVDSIEQALDEQAIIGGNFRLEFREKDLAGAIFTRLNSIRRWFGIYYGDSAIWVRRERFLNLGGFTQARLMEDYEFCRSMERAGRTVCIAQPVVTSGRRWHEYGIARTLILWTAIQWLYMVGISPDRLARLYYRKRL